MAKLKLLFALLLFLIGAVLALFNPTLTGAVISAPEGNSFLVIGLGFLFVLTGLIVAVSAKFDVSTEDYHNSHYDFSFEGETELDKHSFWSEYDERNTNQHAKRRRVK